MARRTPVSQSRARQCASEPIRRRPLAGARLVTRTATAALFVLVLAACGGDDGPDFADAASATPPMVDAPPVEPVEPGAEPPSMPPEGFTVALTPVLEIDEPVDLIVHPTTGQVFVASRTGVIARVDLEAGEIVEELVDLGGRLAGDWVEQGLLGIEFSPAGDELYVNFTDRDGTSVVAVWDTDGTTVDLDSGRTILRVDQPAGNHNGGDLAFGPDGLLYITLGDGGGSGDEYENGQNTSTLLGSILRIDPSGGDPYAIPASNPFVAGGGAPEIYLMGARNPWRIDFDDATGDLWIADVGQDAVEEINVVTADTADVVNLGWPLVEGSVPFAGSGPPTEGYLGPIIEYGHDEGCSITGGVVYRGGAIPELDGVYLFADYCTAELWGVVGNGDTAPATRIDLGVGTGPSPAAFAEGPDGEVYVLSLEGVISRIDPT